MRVRTKDDREFGLTTTHWSGWIPPGWPSPPPCTAGGGFTAECVTGTFRRTTDYLTEGYFWKKKHQKPLPVNVFTSELDAWSSGAKLPTVTMGDAGGPTSTLSMCGPGLSTPKPSVWEVSAPEVPWEPLLQSAWAAVSTSSSWDASTTAAELGKTFQMIANFRRNLVRRAENVLAYVRSSGRRGKGLFETFSDAWLEYRYGWTPLYRDIIDIAEAAAKCAINHEPLVRESRQGSNSSSSSWSDWRLVNANGGPASVEYRVQDTWTRSVRAGTGMVLDTGCAVQIDPVQTAWEVVPWSFVIDWFVGVNDFLATVTPFMNKRPEFLWVTQHDTRTRVTQYRWAWDQKGSGQSTYVEQTKSRMVPTRVPTGVYLKFNLNMKRYVDAAALLKIAARLRV